MDNIELLKYIGVQPLLPNTDFPGAAPSDFFDAKWQIKSQISKNQIKSRNTSHNKVDSAQNKPRDTQNLTAKNIVEDILDPPPSVNIESSSVQLTQQSSQEPKSQHVDSAHTYLDNSAIKESEDKNEKQSGALESAADKSLLSKPHNRVEVEESQILEKEKQQLNIENSATNSAVTDAIKFELVLLKNSALNILVIAELIVDDQKLYKEQLQLLKKIVLSFSADSKKEWRQKRFSWPIKTQKYTPLANNLNTASEIFQGYLEGLQSQEPTHILCFPQKILPQLFELKGFETSHKIQQYEQEKLWPQLKLTMFCDLDVYAHDKTAKADLWQYIKDNLI